MSTLEALPTTEAYEAYITSRPATSLTVLYFHAPWAAPCKQTHSILSTLASTYPVTSPPSISFASVDAEELPDVAEAHEISQVPFVVLRKHGRTLDGVPGTDAARLRSAVEKHHGGDGGSAAARNGKTSLPPLQKVTRPAEQPVPSMPAAPSSAAAAAGTAPSGSNAKDLSSYAPASTDPSTAPEYSSNKSTHNTESDSATSKEALEARLTDLVKAAPVMLFMKGTPSAPQCGFSRQLVSILRENNVRYGFFNILADDEVRQGLKEFSDWPTFPQLYLDGELVGGLDIVKEEVANDPAFLGKYQVEKKVAA